MIDDLLEKLRARHVSEIATLTAENEDLKARLAAYETRSADRLVRTVREIRIYGAYSVCTKCSTAHPLSSFGLLLDKAGLVRNQPQCPKCRDLAWQASEQKARKRDERDQGSLFDFVDDATTVRESDRN